ncbi:MAG: cyclic lactone autoinducer peptide [Clostridia bacterium]|nr:cyclic lactone autoinducer peptide [Clostridia bacterium]
MKQKILRLLAGLAAICAMLAASSASYFFWYQPKEPKCLKP